MKPLPRKELPGEANRGQHFIDWSEMLSVNGYNEVIVTRRRGYIRVNTYWFPTESEAKASKRQTRKMFKEEPPPSHIEILYHQVRPAFVVTEGEDPKAYSCYDFESWKHMQGKPGNNTTEKMSAMLAVSCPKCGMKPYNWCVRPDGRLHQVLHIGRWRAAGGS